MTRRDASVLERGLSASRSTPGCSIDPVPEPVSFDTTLQIGSGNFAVKGE